MAAKNLVIVESAAKAKTLEKFLGKNYKIKASVGHIKDLPKSKLGIDIDNNFEPQYITIRGKGEILKNIKGEAQKVKSVLLATDPDREGEAIAWHLQNAMNIPAEAKCRIEFHEITREAVREAIKNLRPIDMNRVNAQQARRVLDRLVGYNLSPLLWSKVKRGLSAGRVQSVAVRLICDREQEILNFIPEEYWSVTLVLDAGEEECFQARLLTYKGEKITIPNEEEKNEIVGQLQQARIKIADISKKEKRRNPAPPFTTSTLQQEAAKRLNFYSKRTMRVAQELYEGLKLGREGNVGLITYLRTDSTRVSPVAQEETLQYIEQIYGEAYRPRIPHQYKGKKSSQDAHEAIRPTSVLRTPELVKAYLSRDQYRLYKLIWERFIASQMTAALFDTIKVEIEAGFYGLRSTSSQLKFPGYRIIYQDMEQQDEEGEDPIPDIHAGQEVNIKDILAAQHHTQPPPRFTEASLVKILEEKNIGRPSTYAPIIDTILKRNYAERQNRQFVPTELGFIVVDILKQHFGNIVDVEFTAKMEEDLDRVEEGTLEWKQVIEGFYNPFERELEKASEVIEKVEIKDEEAGHDCPRCGKKMLIKHGRFGRFVACEGFPECRHTESYNEPVGVLCPSCGGEVVALKSKKGRGFFGCKNYPDCNFRSWKKPTGELCPTCGNPLVEKIRKNKPVEITCSNTDCDYIQEKEKQSIVGD